MNEVVLKLKRLHPGQQRVINEHKRFNVLRAGRRWGKSTLGTQLCIDPAIDGFPVGVWQPTYKDLNEMWLEISSLLFDITSKKNEQLKQIRLITGGVIDFWSLENPDSGRGRSYKRAIIDEAAKAMHIKQAWEQTIRPTLLDYEGDAWFLSTGKHENPYFNELFKFKEQFHDWESWQFATIDNPYIKPEEIEAARAQLDPFVFAQEFLGEQIFVGDKPFFYAFDKDKHLVKDVQTNFKDTVYLSFDFNVNPLCCIAAQLGRDYIHIFKEFRLANSDIYQLCGQIKTFFNSKTYFRITGDSTGLARHSTNRGNMNAYAIIESELNLISKQFDLPANPPVNESRTLCNAIFARHPSVKISQDCKYLIDDFIMLQANKDGGVDKSNPELSHLADCYRYLINTYCHDFLL